MTNGLVKFNLCTGSIMTDLGFRYEVGVKLQKMGTR